MRKKRSKMLKAKVVSDAKERGIALTPSELKKHYDRLKDSYKKELSK